MAQFAHISKQVARGQAVWFLQWQPFLTKTKLIRGRNVMNKLDTWNPVFCKIFLTVCALIITGLTGPASAQAQGYTVTGHVLSTLPPGSASSSTEERTCPVTVYPQHRHRDTQ